MKWQEWLLRLLPTIIDIVVEILTPKKDEAVTVDDEVRNPNND